MMKEPRLTFTLAQLDGLRQAPVDYAFPFALLEAIFC